MKKLVFLLGLAAISLASCTKDIVKEANKGRAIDFRVAAPTRGSETTSANLTTFYVTAIDDQGANYFSNTAFTKIEEYFSSSPSYFWPGDGSTLDFYAYAPSATTLGAEVNINNSSKTLTDFSPAAEITDQKDFVTAQASGNKDDQTNGVALLFKHQLAQIEVKARNANEGYIYKVKGVRIAQPVANADFDFETESWNLSVNNSDKAVYQTTYSHTITLNTFAQNIMEEEGNNAMLIPQQLVAWDPENDPTNSQKGAYLSVYAQITTSAGAKVYPNIEGQDYAWLAVPIDTEWEAGNKYVYTLDFTYGAGYSDPLDGPTNNVIGDPIRFKVDVTPWDESTAEDPIIGTWDIRKVHTIKYSKQRDETEEEVAEDVETIKATLVPQYITYEWISSTEFYYNEPGYGRVLMTTTIKDGKRVIAVSEGSLIYFDWADESKTKLMMVILSEDDNYKEEYYLYYDKI